MVTDNHYRWDFIGLSTDDKPTPETSDKVVDGSTFYCSDTSKLYVYCQDNWYEKKPLGGGGGGGSYTAGDGIDISDDVISVDTETIQEKLTAGTGIDISDDVISVDTETIQEKLTAGNGIDITNNVISSTGGGGGPTVVQTTGTSTTDVMSQDGTTKLIYPDIANSPYKIVIGEGSISGTNKGLAINGILSQFITNNSIAIGTPDASYAQIGSLGRADNSVVIGSAAGVGRGSYSIAIGSNAFINSGQNTGDNIAIGNNSYAGNGSETSSVALGSYAKTTRTGEVNIGTGSNGTGYNSTNYRVLGGVHDGQLAQDAVTVNQVNSVIDSLNTALNTNIPHIGI